MKRKTNEEFINESNIIHNNKYDYSKTKYVNGSTNVIIICPIHGDFVIKPSKHLNRGQGCPNCIKDSQMNHFNFIKKGNEIHKDIYDYSKIKYVNYSTPVEIICPIHGSFFKNAQNHINGKQGCPKCKKEEYILNTRTTKKEFIERAIKKHGNKYDYSKVSFKSLSDKVIIICPHHGEFEKIAFNHVALNNQFKENSGGCPKCLKKDWILTTEDFIKKSKEVHGSKYEYDRTVYKNAMTKIIVTCPKHGDFKVYSNNHILNLGGCKECANDNKRLSFFDYKERCEKTHNDRYDYSNTENTYTGRNRDKILITCEQHGDFYQSANDHYEGYGCPKCGARKSKYEDWVENYLIRNNISYIKNDRDVLRKHEIDFVLPEHKVGIEVNGLRFHSEYIGKKNPTYHLDKTLESEEMGYKLMHIFSSDIIHNPNIIKSKLNSIFKINKYPISINECDIRWVSGKLSYQFLNKYHIQGNDDSSIKIGAFYKNRLIGLLTLYKKQVSEKTKLLADGEYILSKFCETNSLFIVDGEMELLKYFEKKYKPKKVFVNSDRRFVDYKKYYDYGFDLNKYEQPRFWYFKSSNDSSKLINHFKLIKNKLENFDPKKSEWENMKQNGWDRIWDCGTMVFEKTY